MTTRAVDEIREWDTRPYAGGFDGLHDLADREFTGAVESDDAVLYMLRGRVVGVFDYEGGGGGVATDADDGTLRPADIDSFENATGTAYEAPHPALPLLFAMRATGGEERGRYYTEDTPLEEVHERLSGGFTGYVELSENVLSGDYFSVYHGGRAKHAAFVGQSERLVEDDEAFERACDEVGIYTVTAVELEVVDIPGERQSSSGTTGAAGTAGAAGAGAAGSAGAAESTNDPLDTPTGAAGATEERDAGVGGDGVPEPDATPDATDDETADESVASGSTADHGDTRLDADIPDPDPDAAPTTGPSDSGTMAGADRTDEESPTADAPTPRDAGTDTSVSEAVTSVEGAGDAGGAGDAATVDEPRDADGTTPNETADGTDIESAVEAAEAAPAGVEEAGPEDENAATDSSDAAGVSDTALDQSAGATAEDTEALRSALAARETEVERLESEVDRLETALQEVRDERDDLAARVESLEGRLRDLGAGDSAPETAMTPEEALDGTSIFIRYRSKSEPTLDDLHAGVSREGVVGNLRLEHHTEFDEAAVAVDGRRFEAFLEDSQEYQFVRWLVTDLPLEIRETGSQKSLGDLYAAIPRIDRMEFDATLADDRTFDLVARNRMGEPLLVATLDTSREPMREAAMADLVKGASAVSEASETLAGAMAVTEAFFEPEALATAEDATGGSLLSRDRRESYVKLSRSRGFHLCLVEDREESFYLSIPEL